MKVAEGIPKRDIPPQPRAPGDGDTGLSKAGTGGQGKRKRRGAGLPDEEAAAEEDDDEDDIVASRWSASCRFC